MLHFILYAYNTKVLWKPLTHILCEFHSTTKPEPFYSLVAGSTNIDLSHRLVHKEEGQVVPFQVVFINTFSVSLFFGKLMCVQVHRLP